ncbi:hypothetical protein M153_15900016707 [Pseudoloma neurophilia]|uniref:Uncharacterized protein n=1 Tax=Pseudoloma neurophilia TaxID=146866 RepID=A0A0R0LZP4_9MICR|nr:hypothetical protein M153_15900016707 [Pseudoloma neurophilia]
MFVINFLSIFNIINCSDVEYSVDFDIIVKSNISKPDKQKSVVFGNPSLIYGGHTTTKYLRKEYDPKSKFYQDFIKNVELYLKYEHEFVTNSSMDDLKVMEISQSESEDPSIKSTGKFENPNYKNTELYNYKIMKGFFDIKSDLGNKIKELVSKVLKGDMIDDVIILDVQKQEKCTSYAASFQNTEEIQEDTDSEESYENLDFFDDNPHLKEKNPVNKSEEANDDMTSQSSERGLSRSTQDTENQDESYNE